MFPGAPARLRRPGVLGSQPATRGAAWAGQQRSAAELARVAAGDRIATLLDPAANARAAVRSILGDEAARLAVIREVGGGALSPNGAVLTIAHFGAARGGWRPTGEGVGDLYINPNVYFQNVPEPVWRCEMGGYPVLKKWLGYREARRRGGHPLTLEERDHLRGMVQRLAALLAVGPELDRLYARAAECAMAATETTRNVTVRTS